MTSKPRKIISIVGKHDSGKTTLIKGLLQSLKAKNLKVSVIKNAVTSLTLNSEYDSEILFSAGADAVYATNPGVLLTYQRTESASRLAQIIEMIPAEIDIIITEGFKQEDYPKIEVMRAEVGSTPLNIHNVIAIVSDFPLTSDKPIFSFQNPEEITAFILRFFDSSQ